MSVQIISLRYTKHGNKLQGRFTHFGKSWKAPSVPELFEDPDLALADIPKNERHNLFYTVAHVGGAPATRKSRKFLRSDMVAFDIDLDSKEILTDATARKIFRIACNVLQLDEDMTGALNSGHGLQVLVQLEAEYDVKFLESRQASYKVLMDRLDASLASFGVEASCDMVFDRARVMRVPGSLNSKPELPEVMTTMIQPNIMPQAFLWPEATIAPVVELSASPDTTPAELSEEHQQWQDYLPETSHQAMKSSYDVEAIQSKCLFLRQAYEQQATLSEPEWYAALGVLAFLPGGENLCHDYSREHSGYSMKSTALKVKQALKQKGPRRCDSINRTWSGCPNCEHWQKILSPVTLKGDDHIETESNGFRYFTWKKTEDGHNVLKSARHCPDDLIKAFKRDHDFVCTTDGRVYLFNGCKYEIHYDSTILAHAEHTYKKMPAFPTLEKDRLEFKRKLKTEHQINPQWFADTTHKKINFKNGVLDIETMTLSHHSKEYGFLNQLPYDYRPEARCPNFNSFLAQVTSNDTDLEKVILEMSGYCLSNDESWIHKAMLMTGDGANGKSTFANILCDVAGEGSYSSIEIQELKSDQYRANLEGKLFNISRETSPKALDASENFKKIVSGETVTIKHLYHKPYSIIPRCKMVALCQELPKSSDKSKGLLRRLVIIPFNQEFTEEKGNLDPFVEKKMGAELPGIFNRMMAAYKLVKKRGGFSKSKTIDLAKEAYIKDNDNVVQFIFEGSQWYTPKDPLYEMSLMSKLEIFKHYEKFCETIGTKSANSNNFWKRVKRAFPDLRDREFRAPGGERARKIKGVGLITLEENRYNGR